MSPLLRRARGLVQRYRVDGRLPPQVLQLVIDVIRLRVGELFDQRIAGWRRPIRTARSSARTGPLVRQDAVRVEPSGPLAMSLSRLAHDHAGRLVAVLQECGAEPFVVARRGDRIVLGIGIEHRPIALAELVAGAAEPGWLLDWERGHRSGTSALARSGSKRDVLDARTWRIYRAAAWGDRAAGREQAVEIGFWEIGTSGQLELVGTRGHERFDSRCPSTTEMIDGHPYPGRTAFPVGQNLEQMTEPIDIVYTWVDGADPNWQQSFRTTAAQFGRSVDEVALDPARYRSRDELRYSLRSVWAFCGWVRNIYIVTAGQRPAWLGDDPRIRVVDHSEILPADALPTFNSHAMESALHRIDGLSEHFIYFNDDMLVGRSVRPEMFFTSNGLASVFPSGARVPGVEDEHSLAVDTAARRGRELLAGRFGRVATDKPLHSPYPLRRSVMAEIETDFTDVIHQTSHSRFRSPTDLSVAASFAQHYGLATGRGVIGDIASEYVHVESGRLSWHLDRIRLGRYFDTFCINETEHRGGDVEHREQLIQRFFETYYPIPAPWERDVEALQ